MLGVRHGGREEWTAKLLIIAVFDDSAIRRAEGSISLAQAIDAHDEGVLPSREEDEKNLDNRKFVGRLVQPYNDQNRGRVEQVKNRRDWQLLGKKRCDWFQNLVGFFYY